MIRASRRGVLHGLAAGAVAGWLPRPASAAEAVPDPAHVLWYRQPASAWTEALPIGNGRLGAMVFGGIARERLQLNEDSLGAGGPYNPVNPAAREVWPQVRRLVAAGRMLVDLAWRDGQLVSATLTYGLPDTRTVRSGGEPRGPS